MAELSKTARASMNAGEGSRKRTPIAFVFEHRVGKMQTKPWRTFYVADEAEAYAEQDPERFYVIKWLETRRK
jgi:hypothetical protein